MLIHKLECGQMNQAVAIELPSPCSHIHTQKHKSKNVGKYVLNKLSKEIW